MQKLVFLALAGVLAASAAQAAPAPKEVSVPFASGNIDDFRADGDEAAYLRVNGFHWYHAQLMGPCTPLRYAETIGVETGATNTLDKFSTLLVRGQRCALSSLVESGPPPKKAKRR